MPEWIGTLLFVTAIGLSGAKISRDFGDRGMLGWTMLLVLVVVFAAAVTVAFT